MSTEVQETKPIQTEFDFMSDDAQIPKHQVSFEALCIRAEVGVNTKKVAAGVAVLGNN